MRYHKQVQALEEDLDLAIDREKDDIARMLIRKLHPMRQCVAGMETRMNDHKTELAEAQARLATQTMTYDDIRQRVAAVRERSGAASGMPDVLTIGAALGPQEPSEEEIEWELIQRKEATGAGRMS